MTDEELEKIIRAATPGPWHRGEGWEQSEPGYFIYADKPRPVGGGNIVLSEDTAPRLADADFIAAFNPVIALLLLERVRKAEAKVKHLRLVGTGLANAAYNLKQQTYIPEEHRRSLDEGQRAWDAVLAGDAAPTTSAARRPAPPPETLAEACRQGAEEMREQAAQRLELSAAEHRAAKARATPDAHEAWEQTALTLDLEAMAIRDLSLPGDKS